ncbi:peptidylprolyl isomerase, partial [Candidatus Sumerlaeota bacterium]|nr:peptidylprolyl isomerase [Candidatus Sumerlaeota bacterium]
MGLLSISIYTLAEEAKTPAAEVPKAKDALHPLFKMETTLGDIILELDAEKAPISTFNFLTYSEEKYYE